MRAFLFAGLAALTFTACSHRMFQFEPNADAARENRDAIASLVSAGPDGKRQVAVDLDGRLAMLELLGETTLLRGSLPKPSKELLGLATLMVRGTRESGRPFTEPELQGTLAQGLSSGAKAAAKALKLKGAEEFLAANRFGEPPDADTRLRALNEKVNALSLEDCRSDAPEVSYKASILKHVDTPETDRWRDWMDGLKSVSLVTVRCEGAEGVVLLSRHGNQAPRVLVWQFFPPEQWAPLEARLEKLLGQG